MKGFLRTILLAALVIALVPSAPALAQATAPTVTDVTPETGSAASATTLVVNGTGFTDGRPGLPQR